MGEFILIMVVALIVLGPKQLLETAKVAGKVYRELVKMATDLRNSVDLDALTADHKPHVPPPPPTPPAPRTDSSDAAGESMPPAAEKSGPDFYADLLENAREEIRAGEAQPQPDKGAEVPAGPEKGEQAVQPSENAKTT